MFRKIIFLITFILLFCLSFSRELIFEQNKTENKLFFDFYSFTFFDNIESESTLTDGYTLTGAQLLPHLIFNEQKYKITLGWNLLSYSGLDEFSTNKLFFSTKISPYPKMNFTLGSFYNKNSFITPIYSSKNDITQLQKDGVNIEFTPAETKYNLWLDWREYIFEGSNYQEEFTLGFSNYKVAERAIFFPIQLITTHKGGEIDITDSPKQTLLNFSSGVDLQITKQIVFKNNFVGFSDLSNVNTLPFTEGYGYFSTINYLKNNFLFKISYFYADDFYSPLGNPYFWSSSENNIFEKDYVMNFEFDILYKLRIDKNIIFNLKIESNYDLQEKRINYSYGFFTEFNKIFNIKED